MKQERIYDSVLTALSTIPKQVTFLVDRKGYTLDVRTVADEIEADRKKIEEFRDFTRTFKNKHVIGLIGMVNAGKSSLGNWLLQKESSEIFKEAAMVETAEVQYVKWGKHILMDLPGIGSVRSQQDDELVKAHIRRADLLLIVMNAKNDLPAELDKFIREETIKDSSAQRIIIIFNKVEGDNPFDDLEDAQQYQNTIMHGSRVRGAERNGIQSYFDYKVPVEFFSVRDARKNKGNQFFNLTSLQETIQLSLAQMTTRYTSQAIAECRALLNKWNFLEQYRQEIAKSHQDLTTKHQNVKKVNKEELIALIENQCNQLYQDLESIPVSLSGEMNLLKKPNLKEHFMDWANKSEGYLKKRKEHYEAHQKASEAVESIYGLSISLFKEQIKSVIHGNVGIEPILDLDADELRVVRVPFQDWCRSIFDFNIAKHFDWTEKGEFAISSHKYTCQKSLQSFKVAYRKRIFDKLEDVYSEFDKPVKALAQALKPLNECNRELMAAEQVLEQSNNFDLFDWIANLFSKMFTN